MVTLSEAKKSLPGYYTIAEVSETGPLTHVIQELKIAPIREGEDEKPYLVFVNCNKRLVLNKSRVEMLSVIAPSDDPAGTKVTLEVGVYNVGGRKTQMILIKEAS